ncbi:hypothetical protein BDY19DRAFT_981773 [Irpex rosettiformis]|uniref:Uncharacterized protein n=1 Tax=Irpex rosettiformis TaxID=378272 RepID=A0ACB8UJA7_9APHY|nr:hypothetical protein BDY19DRAFT_981773 [Irpex rosettiformis]
MKKWAPFTRTAQAPNGTAGTHEPDPLPVITAADAKMFGLENVSVIFYANSVLQALYFCGPFRDLLVQYPDATQPDPSSPPPSLPPLSPPTSPPPSQPRPKPSRKQSVSEPPGIPLAPNITSPSPIPSTPPTLLSALRSLYLYISRNPAEKGTIAPRAFIDKLKELNELFRSTMHQDAHEFLNYLLNQIVEEMDEQRKKSLNGNGSLSVATTTTTGPHTNSSVDFIKSTLVHQLFEGTLTSETRCLTCETVSSRDESFLDLSIDIEQNSSVTACLRQFSASEMLCQRNKFFCDGCCDLQEAEKRMKIKKLPNILALHLKRFKYQEDLGKYIKLAYRVAFPLELRLFNTADGTSNPDRLYELFAIVVHIGSGPHHGHYVSIVKARGTWYLFDDDKIEAVKETDIPKYFGDSNAGSAASYTQHALTLPGTLHPRATTPTPKAKETRPNAQPPPSQSPHRPKSIITHSASHSLQLVHTQLLQHAPPHPFHPHTPVDKQRRRQ